jgi:hypothetical protein
MVGKMADEKKKKNMAMKPGQKGKMADKKKSFSAVFWKK